MANQEVLTAPQGVIPTYRPTKQAIGQRLKKVWNKSLRIYAIKSDQLPCKRCMLCENKTGSTRTNKIPKQKRNGLRMHAWFNSKVGFVVCIIIQPSVHLHCVLCYLYSVFELYLYCYSERAYSMYYVSPPLLYTQFVWNISAGWDAAEYKMVAPSNF